MNSVNFEYTGTQPASKGKAAQHFSRKTLRELETLNVKCERLNHNLCLIKHSLKPRGSCCDN